MTADFFDTNILVYAFIADARAEKARALIGSGGAVSVQCLNEFVNVARNKLKMEWERVHEAIERITFLCKPIVPISFALHRHAVAITERHKVHIFDALIIAAALEVGSSTLWSEDMQNGMIVDGRLAIRNPFGAR